MNSEAIFETARLRLEPLRRAHAAEMFALLSDPRMYLYIPQKPPADVASLADTYERLESRTSPDGEERWLNWIARSKADGDCIGFVQVTLRPDASAYFAYEIGVAHWNQGFATEACARILEAIFDDPQIDHVVAEVDTRNAASIRLLERLGFECSEARQDELTYRLARRS
jgi:ribosomal-protein-alanine N-acetyltransferase